jgi:hypothetical protein
VEQHRWPYKSETDSWFCHLCFRLFFCRETDTSWTSVCVCVYLLDKMCVCVCVGLFFGVCLSVLSRYLTLFQSRENTFRLHKQEHTIRLHKQERTFRLHKQEHTFRLHRQLRTSFCESCLRCPLCSDFFYTLYLLNAYRRSFPQVQSKPKVIFSFAAWMGTAWPSAFPFTWLKIVLGPNCNLRCKAQKDQRIVCWQTCLNGRGREGGKLCEHGDELASCLKCTEVLNEGSVVYV